ncbi:MAG: transaldolase [Acaryochloris sp. RU_4_1]|nr:transaldolase [Acaryochloris sp. RU_4_1]NJR54841.1 transaldolase [Acaryochloris sp. CRU_2_0]
MYFYLDTAKVDQWEHWLTKGLFYGVTTNPILLEQAQVPCSLAQLQQLATQAFQLGAQEIHLQTWGTEVAELVARGQAIAAIDQRAVVKVPITLAGTEAATQLLTQGIRVTLTGVYAIHQVLIAAAIKANFAAPYLGRITALGENGPQQLATMQQILDRTHSSTKLLVASIRNIEEMTYLATQGLDTFTLSPSIADELFAVEVTQKAALAFEDAANRMR